MNRYFLIREEDGLIVSSILWDGICEWKPFDGFYVLPESDNLDARNGWRKVEGGWERPPSRKHYWNGTEWYPPKPYPTVDDDSPDEYEWDGNEWNLVN